MKNISENPIWQWIGSLADLVLLNLCWLLCSLPVVTAGAAAQAMFRCAGKMAEGRKWRLREDFFAAFRADLGLSVRFWLPMLVFEVLVGFDLWYGGRAGLPLLTMAAVVFAALWCMAAVWGFALIGRFHYVRARDVLRDALAMAAANPHVSLTAVLLTVWAPAALLLWPAFVSGILPAIVLLDGSLSALILSALMLPGFRRIEKQRETSENAEDNE